MKKAILLITCITFCISIKLFAQNQQKIDSLKKILKGKLSDKDKTDVWNELADEYSNYDSTLTFLYANKAIILAKKNKYFNAIIDAQNHQAWLLMQIGYLEEAEAKLKKNLVLAEKKQYNVGKSYIFNTLGTIRYYSYRLNSALDYYKKSLAIRKKIGNKNQIASSYMNISVIYDAQGDAEKAQQYNFKALKVYKAIGDKKEIGQCYLNIGATYAESNKYHKAFDYYIKSLDIFSKIQDKNLMITTYNNIGVIYNRLGNYLESLKYFYKALRVAEKINNETIIASCYQNIGNTQANLANYSLARKYFHKALKNYKKLKRTRDVASIYSLIAETYDMQSKYDKGLTYYLKVLEVSNKINDIQLKVHIYIPLSSNYMDTGKYQQAKKYLMEGLEICKNNQSAFMHELILIYMYLGKLNYYLEEFNISKQHLLKGLRLADEIQSIHLKKNILEILTPVEEGLKNYKEAYENHKLFKEISDSLFNKEKSKQLIGLEIQYETEKKEQRIKDLEQKTKIKDLNIQSKNLQLSQTRLYFIIVSITLLLTGIILYLFARQKRLRLEQKSQHIEQKLLRVQMNPHFIFNAIIAIQEYMFDTDKQKTSIYLTKFSKLIRQILENSRNEYVALEEEVNMLENYLSLQKLRQKINFEYKIIVDEDLDIEEVAIPPMFAQPFVENAIEHGIAEVPEGGKIQIHFTQENNQIILKIEDNGIGIQKSTEIKQNTEGKHKSLATQITKERIEIFKRSLKKDIGFKIQELKQGTAIIFRLPYQYV